MMSLLFLLLLIPLVAGGLLLLFAGVSQQRTARWIALGGTIASLAISLGIASQYRQLLAEQQAAAVASGNLWESPVKSRVDYRQPWLNLANPSGDTDAR